MTWFVASLRDHDTHLARNRTDDTVIALCGRSFRPLTRLAGGKSARSARNTTGELIQWMCDRWPCDAAMAANETLAVVITAFVTGVLLGLALIIPIGPQNVLVLSFDCCRYAVAQVRRATSLSVTSRETVSQRAEVPYTATLHGSCRVWHLRNKSVHLPEGLVGLM
ncbi:MAG: hypothetical protein ACRDTE_13730 [Pseudonocardiaceae bacterium]